MKNGDLSASTFPDFDVNNCDLLTSAMCSPRFVLWMVVFEGRSLPRKSEKSVKIGKNLTNSLANSLANIANSLTNSLANSLGSGRA